MTLTDRVGWDLIERLASCLVLDCKTHGEVFGPDRVQRVLGSRNFVKKSVRWLETLVDENASRRTMKNMRSLGL
jgi:hypothetical protein